MCIISEHSAGEGEIGEYHEGHEEEEHSHVRGIFKEPEFDHGHEVPFGGEELEAEVSQRERIVKKVYEEVNVQEDEPKCVHNRQDTQIPSVPRKKGKKHQHRKRYKHVCGRGEVKSQAGKKGAEKVHPLECSNVSILKKKNKPVEQKRDQEKTEIQKKQRDLFHCADQYLLSLEFEVDKLLKQ